MATRELTKLVLSRLGLQLPEDAALAKLRSIMIRYVLAGEFRSNLNCAPPAVLDSVPAPSTKNEESAVRELAAKLRTNFPEAYSTMADRVDSELRLGDAKISPDALGSIETFRFEERAVLAHCGDLIAAKQFDSALATITARERSFWLDRDVARKAQWESCRRMAELGRLCLTVLEAIGNAGTDVNAWIDGYTSKDGWFLLDRAQRRLANGAASIQENERAPGPLPACQRVWRNLPDRVCLLGTLEDQARRAAFGLARGMAVEIHHCKVRTPPAA